MRDGHRRSIVKAIGYRCMGIGVLAVSSWIFTRDVLIASSITLAYHLVSITGYYVYERIWERIKWGRK